MDPPPKKILEIGVAEGEGAIKMIKAAKRKGATNIWYWGFDLHVPDSLELKLKRKTEKDVKITLIKGDTRKTLPVFSKTLPKQDLIYIDGGHSYEVVKSDWENIQRLLHKNTLVVFHDYGIEEGVTKVVDRIDRRRYKVTIWRIAIVKLKRH